MCKFQLLFYTLALTCFCKKTYTPVLFFIQKSTYSTHAFPLNILTYTRLYSRLYFYLGNDLKQFSTLYPIFCFLCLFQVNKYKKVLKNENSVFFEFVRPPKFTRQKSGSKTQRTSSGGPWNALHQSWHSGQHSFRVKFDARGQLFDPIRSSDVLFRFCCSLIFEIEL